MSQYILETWIHLYEHSLKGMTTYRPGIATKPKIIQEDGEIS